MRVAVCVNQVPCPGNGRLILDPVDRFGVEAALQLVASAGGGEVVVVCIARRGEKGGVRTALAMGADRGVVLGGEALDGSDALGTAKVLAAAITRIDADVVVAAAGSSARYTGAVPAQLAELLGLPCVTPAARVELAGAALRVERQTEDGFDEVRCPLPAVVAVAAGAVEPRYPSFEGVMAARTRPVEELGVGELHLDAATVGRAGARQEIVEVVPAEERRDGHVVHDDGSAHLKIVELLERLEVI